MSRLFQPDVYFTHQGMVSLRIVIIFGQLLVQLPAFSFLKQKPPLSKQALVQARRKIPDR